MAGAEDLTSASSMSAWIGANQYLDYFNSPDSILQGGITASMSAGSFGGAIAAGFISDYLGRRVSLMIACWVWIVGAAIQCSAQNVAHLIVGRVVSGLAVGVTSSQVCVYLAELAPARVRGRIVGIQQWAIEWGMLIMYLIAYGCIQGLPDSPSSFRICWGIQGVPGIILFIALFFFPESPRWLASKERWEECLDTLSKLHGNGDHSNPEVQVEFEEVREAARIAHEAQDVSILALFSPKLLKRTICGMSVQMWQQLLGGNVAMYYVVYIFDMAGMTGDTSLYSSVIQYVIFLVTTGVVLPWIDQVGRRPVFLTGSILCMSLHYAIAGTMAMYGYPVSSVNGNSNLRWRIQVHPGKAVIACSYIFTGVYGFTWAPTAWVYASEVFPLKYRANGVGISASINWIFNFALAYFVAPAFTNIQWKTYIIFGVFCTVMTLQVFFGYPETRQRTLEEMDVIFNTNMKPWQTASLHDKLDLEIRGSETRVGGREKEEVGTTHTEL